MSDVLETRAGTAANRYPWPRANTATPVCADHDPELWFPHDKDNYAEAVALCGRCPLVGLCREVAIARGETGVWGGVLFKGGRPLSSFPEPGRPKKEASGAAA